MQNVSDFSEVGALSTQQRNANNFYKNVVW